MQIKITSATITIDGMRRTVRVVRDSHWCRWLKQDMVVLGNTVHFKSDRLKLSTLNMGLDEYRKVLRLGKMKYYWRLLTANGI